MAVQHDFHLKCTAGELRLTTEILCSQTSFLRKACTFLSLQLSTDPVVLQWSQNANKGGSKPRLSQRKRLPSNSSKQTRYIQSLQQVTFGVVCVLINMCHSSSKTCLRSCSCTSVSDMMCVPQRAPFPNLLFACGCAWFQQTTGS